VFTTAPAQQQYFFLPNQHCLPSPRLSLLTLLQLAGHLLLEKQNGAVPYHLHIS
jgi:hypothetical protein